MLIFSWRKNSLIEIYIEQDQLDKNDIILMHGGPCILLLPKCISSEKIIWSIDLRVYKNIFIRSLSVAILYLYTKV